MGPPRRPGTPLAASASSTGGLPWLVTGASSGLGRALVGALLDRGHAVVGAARHVDGIPAGATAVPLDVTDAGQVTAVVGAAGPFDVVVNGAGSLLVGAVEQVDDAAVTEQLDTNLLGAWRVIRAVLPGMRRRRSGTIVNVSSVGGFAGGAGLGAYNASKFALEGMSEALAAEVAPFGIRVMVVEPGPYPTNMRRAMRTAARADDDAYPDHAAALRAADGRQPGDPVVAAAAVVAAVERTDPPFRLVLDAVARDAVEVKLNEVRRDLDHCQHLY